MHESVDEDAWEECLGILVEKTDEVLLGLASFLASHPTYPKLLSLMGYEMDWFERTTNSRMSSFSSVVIIPGRLQSLLGSRRL